MRNATLSVVEHGPLRTFDFPVRYLKGAVYDDRSRLVVESQKVGLAGYPWVPADPVVYQGKKVRRQLEGRWLYGGHWI